MNAVLEDGDRAKLMTALRYVTVAFGGVSAVAQKTGLNTTTLYRTLSPRGNPELKSFMDIMKAVGMGGGADAVNPDAGEIVARQSRKCGLRSIPMAPIEDYEASCSSKPIWPVCESTGAGPASGAGITGNLRHRRQKTWLGLKYRIVWR